MNTVKTVKTVKSVSAILTQAAFGPSLQSTSLKDLIVVTAKNLDVSYESALGQIVGAYAHGDPKNLNRVLESMLEFSNYHAENRAIKSNNGKLAERNPYHPAGVSRIGLLGGKGTLSYYVAQKHSTVWNEPESADIFDTLGILLSAFYGGDGNKGMYTLKEAYVYAGAIAHADELSNLFPAWED